jgi:hypothetical protein
VSLVDHRPQELVVLTLDGLLLEWASGSSGGLAYSQFGAKLRDLQVRFGTHCAKSQCEIGVGMEGRF